MAIEVFYCNSSLAEDPGDPLQSSVSRHGGLVCSTEIDLRRMANSHCAEYVQFSTSSQVRHPSKQGGRSQQDASTVRKRWVTKANPSHVPHF